MPARWQYKYTYIWAVWIAGRFSYGFYQHLGSFGYMDLLWQGVFFLLLSKGNGSSEDSAEPGTNASSQTRPTIGADHTGPLSRKALTVGLSSTCRCSLTVSKLPNPLNLSKYSLHLCPVCFELTHVSHPLAKNLQSTCKTSWICYNKRVTDKEYFWNLVWATVSTNSVEEMWCYLLFTYLINEQRLMRVCGTDILQSW